MKQSEGWRDPLWLQAHTALAEALSSVPSTHNEQFTATYRAPVLEGSNLGLRQYLRSHAHTDTCTQNWKWWISLFKKGIEKHWGGQDESFSLDPLPPLSPQSDLVSVSSIEDSFDTSHGEVLHALLQLPDRLSLVWGRSSVQADCSETCHGYHYPPK